MLKNSLRVFFGSLLPLFVLAHFTHHVITAVAAPLLPLIRSSFSLSYTQAGLLLSSFTVTYGLAHLPSGWLSDRIGPVPMIFVGIAGVALAGLLFGLAPGFGPIILANALMGLCGSGYHPAAASLIARVARPERRGSALGVHVIGGSASYFLAPLLAGGIAAAWGWRGAYVSLSLPTLLLGLVLFLLLRRAAARRGISRAAGEGAQPGDRPAVSGVRIAFFLALTTLSGALIGSATGFIPLLLVDSFGLREEAAAGLMAVIFSAGFWAAPLAGFLSDRVGKLALLLAACALVVPVVFLLPRLPFGSATYVLLVLLGLFMFVRMPVSESYLISVAPPRARSTLLGVYFQGSSLGGGAFTPLLGRLIDLYGFRYSFAFTAAVILALTVICAGGLWLSLPGRLSRR